MRLTIRILINLAMINWAGISMLPADGPAVLPVREQGRLRDQVLARRLEKVLPQIMRREQIDLWVVICREYNEDPVFLTLVPAEVLSARRLSILVFFDRGAAGVERLAVGKSGYGGLYRAMWTDNTIDQWQCLAKVITERNPRRIGIDSGPTFAFGDGLSASLKEKLVQALGTEPAGRLVSAEKVAVGWLEYRTPEELELYPHIAAIGHHVIAEAFSNAVITPGVTTTDDVVWWMRERLTRLGLPVWFQPTLDIQRSGRPELPRAGNSGSGETDNTIHRGDLLHCDLGFTYLGLCTDMQELAYVLKSGETDAPAGWQRALAAGNRLQDILTGEMRALRTGNEILLAALEKARGEGLKASIYCHPVGIHGHAAGPVIGMWDQQKALPGAGEYPLYPDTCHSIELNVKVTIPEWGNQEVRVPLEEDAVFTAEGISFIDGRQTRLHLIR